MLSLVKSFKPTVLGVRALWYYAGQWWKRAGVIGISEKESDHTYSRYQSKPQVQEFISHLSTSCSQIQFPGEHEQGYTSSSSGVEQRCNQKRRHASDPPATAAHPFPRTRRQIATCSLHPQPLWEQSVKRLRFLSAIIYVYLTPCVYSSLCQPSAGARSWIQLPQDCCLIEEPRATWMLTAGFSGRKTIV